MSDLGLYIAASALDAQQIGMDTVSQDLANVNTPQYAREEVNLTAVQGSRYTSGAGVMVPSVDQITSSVVTAAMMTADGMLSQQQATNQILNQAQNLFPEPNGGGIQSQLAQFWSEWDTVANEPANAGARQALVTDAQQLAGSLNQTSQSLTQLASTTYDQLQSTINQANQDLAQVAALNQQIGIAQAGKGDANSLIDQQRQLLDQLSQSLGVTYRTQANGTVTVYLGGLEVVQDNSTLPQPPPPLPLQLKETVPGQSSSTEVVYTAYPGGTSVVSPPLGGTAQGLLSTLSVNLPNYQNQLNNVASALATVVNNQQASGYYWAGAAGSAPSSSGATAYAGNVDTSGNPLSFFTSNSGAAITAQNISVNTELAANPFYIAASNQSTLASTESSAAIGANTNIVAGSNDTIDLSLNGVAATLTIPAGSYSPTNLAVAIQNQLDAAYGAGQATATINPAGYLVISATAASSPNPGPPPTGSTLQITGGTALPTLGLAAMPIATVGTQQQNNGQNAMQAAELSNLPVPSPSSIYQDLISQIGADVNTSNTTLKAQQAMTTTADNSFQTISGVSTDEETVKMQLFQNAYQAAAKVVTSVEAMFQSLLQAV